MVREGGDSGVSEVAAAAEVYASKVGTLGREGA